jgi:hypothetical protein
MNSFTSDQTIQPTHLYEVRPRKGKREVDLISDALPFGRLWYTKPDGAIGYAKFRSRSHDAVIRVYDEAGNVTETHEHKGEFKEWRMGSGWRSSRGTRAEITGE